MQETDAFSIQHTASDGIERITYTPKRRRFETPLLMQHGMWHGAWSWQPWQELFAEWGWETHAHSLPGHGQSPVQRPIRWATLNYYFDFLVNEIERQPCRPVLMGHSMGGALIQWYLKYGNDLPAAVLIAPWPSHNMLRSIFRSMKRDPLGALLCILSLTAAPMVRNPTRAAEMFINSGALYSAEALYARLGPESWWVLWQYNPLLWSPAARQGRPRPLHAPWRSMTERPAHTIIPLLWLAGAADSLISEAEERRSAEHYGAEYVAVPGAGHNLMMEKSYRETAGTIHAWLEKCGIR